MKNAKFNKSVDATENEENELGYTLLNSILIIYWRLHISI